MAEARAGGIDVVGDFERPWPGSSALMGMTNHIIVPLGFFGEGADAEEAVRSLAAVPGRSLACVTDGENGAWFASGDSPDRVMHQPVFPVDDVVDTTGCGDVFHGAYCAGLVSGLSPAERIRRASASAAMKTRTPGAQAGAPTREELDAFLAGK